MFYEMGAIPSVFAFRGGYGDIAAGLLGGLAALMLMLGVRPSVTLPVMAVLTIEGLLDFGLVLYTGLTAVPLDGPFQEFHPFFLIPALAVPLFILAHAYAIRAVLRVLLNLRGAVSPARPAPIAKGARA